MDRYFSLGYFRMRNSLVPKEITIMIQLLVYQLAIHLHGRLKIWIGREKARVPRPMFERLGNETITTGYSGSKDAIPETRGTLGQSTPYME
jgi:hypothetical protein